MLRAVFFSLGAAALLLIGLLTLGACMIGDGGGGVPYPPKPTPQQDHSL